MENYKRIDKRSVWTRLQAGKKIHVAILKSRRFNEELYNLTKNWGVEQINTLVSDQEKNVEFFEEIEKGV